MPKICYNIFKLFQGYFKIIEMLTFNHIKYIEVNPHLRNIVLDFERFDFDDISTPKSYSIMVSLEFSLEEKNKSFNSMPVKV